MQKIKQMHCLEGKPKSMPISYKFEFRMTFVMLLDVVSILIHMVAYQILVIIRVIVFTSSMHECFMNSASDHELEYRVKSLRFT